MIKNIKKSTIIQDTVVEKATAASEIDVPEIMFENEVDRMLQEFEQRLQMQGMNLELYFQFSGQNEQALRDQMKEEAEQRVRGSLTLEAIGKAENIEASEEELNEELEKMSSQYNMTVENIRSCFR